MNKTAIFLFVMLSVISYGRCAFACEPVRADKFTPSDIEPALRRGDIPLPIFKYQMADLDSIEVTGISTDPSKSAASVSVAFYSMKTGQTLPLSFTVHRFDSGEWEFGGIIICR